MLKFSMNKSLISKRYLHLKIGINNSNKIVFIEEKELEMNIRTHYLLSKLRIIIQSGTDTGSLHFASQNIDI